MKQLLLSLLAYGIYSGSYAQITPGTGPWTKAAVIIADDITNIVYVRKIDDANLYTFIVKKEHIKKFLPGEPIEIQFNNPRVHIIATRSHPEERIWITDLHLTAFYSEDFYWQLLIIERRSTVNMKNTIYRKLKVEGRRESNQVQACCFEGTANGVQFTISERMVESDLLPYVYIFNDLVVTQKQTGSYPLKIFPITGYYSDSTHEIDTTPSPPKQFEQDQIYAKPSTRDTAKWSNTPAKNLKGDFGQLDMNFPQGLDWNIGNLYITRQSDNKNITSFSGTALKTKKFYNMAPGEYLIYLNNLPIENVPIQKGQVTKLKVGILNVTAEDRWEIYNETKEKYYTSYNKPIKFLIPVGNYQLYIGGQYYPITIREGETVTK